MPLPGRPPKWAAGRAQFSPCHLRNSVMTTIHVRDRFVRALATVCVGLHIAGVLAETRRSRSNLIKAMVTGRKTVPGAAQ